MTPKGYTLVELLIVITITIIISGVGIAGFREFSRRQALTGILKQTKADLRLAQQLALTGQKPKGLICTKLNSYTFNRTNSTNYQLIANCTNVNHIFKNVDMPTNTTISTGNIIFKILGQGTNLISPLTLTITNLEAETSGMIIIGTGGDIQ